MHSKPANVRIQCFYFQQNIEGNQTGANNTTHIYTFRKLPCDENSARPHGCQTFNRPVLWQLVRFNRPTDSPTVCRLKTPPVRLLGPEGKTLRLWRVRTSKAPKRLFGHPEGRAFGAFGVFGTLASPLGGWVFGAVDSGFRSKDDQDELGGRSIWTSASIREQLQFAPPKVHCLRSGR